MLFFGLYIEDEKGSGHPYGVIVERRNEPRLSKGDFVKIMPGEQVEKTEEVPIDGFNIKVAGNYFLITQFYGLYSQDKAPAGIKFWDGWVSAKPIRIKVVE